MKNFLEKSCQINDMVVISDGYLLQVKAMFTEVCQWLNNLSYEQLMVYVEYQESGKFKFITDNGEILNYTIKRSKRKIIDPMESFIQFLVSRDIKIEVEDIPDKIEYKISFRI